MPETLAEQLHGSTLKDSILQYVAAEGFDEIEPDFNDHARFVIAAVRAVARRQNCGLCVLIYSEAPMPEGKPLGFERISHMQEGHGEVAQSIVLTSRDANNGAALKVSSPDLEALLNCVDNVGFEKRISLIWDEAARVATVYPEGIENQTNHVRFTIPLNDVDLTQDDVCEVLNAAYDLNLKNPSGHTAHLWRKGVLVPSAEDEIERHLKGQMDMHFAGQNRPVRVHSQMNTGAGRTDLVLLQRAPTGGPPRAIGVVELKVLRGAEKADWDATKEGLSQGFYYKNDLHLPFATLALYDVKDQPSDDLGPLLKGQEPKHLAEVRVRLFPIYGSPKKWRDAQTVKAA